MENWKWIEGFEGYYKISDMGNVKSFHKKKERTVSIYKTKNGYCQVGLFLNGKIVSRPYVHQLVAEAFIRKYDRTTEQCHHKNHNRSDNRLQNLQILSIQQHSKDEIRLQNMSKSLKGRQTSDKQKRAVSERMKQLWSNEQFKKSMSQKHKGKKRSEETKQKLKSIKREKDPSTGRFVRNA